MEEVGMGQEKLGVLKGDNHSAVNLTKTTESHSKVKHISICHHYIRELVNLGKLQVDFV